MHRPFPILKSNMDLEKPKGGIDGREQKVDLKLQKEGQLNLSLHCHPWPPEKDLSNQLFRDSTAKWRFIVLITVPAERSVV